MNLNFHGLKNLLDLHFYMQNDFRYMFFEKRKPYAQFKAASIDCGMTVFLSIRAENEIIRKIGFRYMKTKNEFKEQHKKIKSQMIEGITCSLCSHRLKIHKGHLQINKLVAQ